jgi:ketosteroid isomerase-like protein
MSAPFGRPKATVMHPHAEVITRFYTAFQRRDSAGMAACCHPQVHFSDPVFPNLRGRDVTLMWEMLCRRGQDLRIHFNSVQADDQAGTAEWEAWYTFSATGRPVHNRISAEFAFREGTIIRHIDRFPFWRWSRQALGPVGGLLGWSGLVRGRVRKQAKAALAGERRQSVPTDGLR